MLENDRLARSQVECGIRVIWLDLKELEMVVFDLRVEAQQLSVLYVVAAITLLLVLASFAPPSVRSRQSLLVPGDVRPLALIFVVALMIMVWHENDERKKADSTMEQCISGGCNVVEGRVSGVRPVHAVGGSRFSQAISQGSFDVGNEHFTHYPSDYQLSYSPSNLLSDGDLVRVYTMGKVLVMVEKIE